MRFCLNLAGIGLAAAVAGAADAPAQPVHRASLVVRADRRSGRLIRSVVVSPQVVRETVVEPRVIAPVVPSNPPAAGRAGLEGYAQQTARRYEVDPLLVHSMIQVESGYNPYAISSKGARGVMQLMPATARRLQVGNSFDPWENIEGGVRYLKYLLALFGSERLAVAAYNAGEGAVLKYGNVPPYSETTHYVRQVGKKYGAAREAARKTESSRPKPASPPAHPPIHQFQDAQGRLHVETRSGP